MGKEKKNRGQTHKFNIADPQIQVDNYLKEASSKYKLGEKGLSFYQIREMKPVFAFDYISMNGGATCFNNSGLKKEDFIGLLSGLKKVSEFTYNKLNVTPSFRFHKIDFDKDNVTISKNDFKEMLCTKPEALADEELPNLWQFDLQYVAEARVAGFLYKGVFYLVWYDRNHQIYG